MKFFIRTAGYTLFDNKMKEILEDLKAELVFEELTRYKSNSLRHVTRRNKNRMTKILLNW